jgi:hypothetical protein
LSWYGATVTKMTQQDTIRKLSNKSTKQPEEDKVEYRTYLHDTCTGREIILQAPNRLVNPDLQWIRSKYCLNTSPGVAAVPDFPVWLLCHATGHNSFTSQYLWNIFFFYRFCRLCIINERNKYFSRSRWPCGLTNELSSLAQTLGSWVRISFKARLSVYAFFLCLCCRVCR